MGKPFKKRVNVASQCSSWSALISGPSAQVISIANRLPLKSDWESFVDKAQNLTSFRCSYRVIYLDVVNI